MLKAFRYFFNGRATPGPGVAREVEFQMFQNYPSNEVQGSGALVQRFMRPYEPQYQTIALVPVPTGDSGVITGGFYHLPLMNTSNDVTG